VDEVDGGEEITDDELCRLALAADPAESLGPDAVPITLNGERESLLPAWYMPSPVASTARRGSRWVLVCLAVGLVVINGAGLCVTYGLPEIAW